MADPPNQNRPKPGRKNGGSGGQNGNQEYGSNGNRNTNSYNKGNHGNASELAAGVHVQVHNHSYSHSYSHTHAQIYPPNFGHPQQPPQIPVAAPSQTPIIVNGGANTKLNSSVTVFSSVSVQHQQQHQQQQMPPQQQPPLLQHPPRPQGERVHVNNVINQDMHSFWTYGTAAFMQPILPPPNVPLSYAIPSNAVQYQPMPVYANGPPPQQNPAMHGPQHVNAAGNQALVPIQHGPPPPPPPGAAHYQRIIQPAPPQQPLLQQQQPTYHDLHHQQQFHNPYPHSPLQQRPHQVPMQRKDPQMMGPHMPMPQMLPNMPPSFEQGQHQLQAPQEPVFEEVFDGEPLMQDEVTFSPPAPEAAQEDKPAEEAEALEQGESSMELPSVVVESDLPEEKTDIGNCCLAEDNFLWSSENSQNVLKSEDVLEVALNEGGGDAAIISSSMDIEGMLRESHTKFHDFFRLALRGSEIAEKLAFVHRNRPCFKKMDSLCARIKQDLIRSDNVLPNINSQGLVWAVKDFIFVFTRIINAWVIVKGYVYNTPEGLSSVKAALSTDFPANFIAWQSATSDFIDSLTRSFINLDNLVQMRSTFQRTDIGSNGLINRNTMDSTSPPQSSQCAMDSNVGMSSFSEDKGEEDLKDNASHVEQNNQGNSREETNYHFGIVANPEKNVHEIDMNGGTYLKTGTYLPLQKENVMETAAVDASPPKCEPSAASTEAVTRNEEQRPASWSSSKDFGSFVISPNSMGSKNALAASSTMTHDIQYEGDDPDRFLSEELMEKLNIIIENLMSMHTADLFFKTEFIKNYFPEFLETYQGYFMDVRTIILKCQTGGYMTIDEVVHDVRMIIFHVNLFLKNNYNIKLHKTVDAFDREFREIFNMPPFVPGEFDYITGDPAEILKPYQ